MIIDQKEICADDFLKEFKKRFTNFCTKIPLFINSLYTPTKIIVFSYKTQGNKVKEKLFEYDFNFTIDVKENIYEIKKILQEKYYPIMTEIVPKEEIYTPEKLNYLIAEGKISIDDVTLNNGVIENKEINWRIEKIILDDDSMLIRNLEEDKLYKTYVKMPVITFLKTILNSLEDKYDRWEFFNRRKRNIELFYEVDKNNNKLKKYENNRRL